MRDTLIVPLWPMARKLMSIRSLQNVKCFLWGNRAHECERLFSQLEKVRAAYHKCCQKEQTALDKEKQANEDAETSPEKKQKLASARESATEDKEKVKAAQSNTWNRD